MSLQGSQTKADYIEWNLVQSLILKLERDGDWKFALLIAIGSYTGLRISDLLVLRWNNIFNVNTLLVNEQKTKKDRKISLNPQLNQIIARIFKAQGEIDPSDLVFINRWRTRAITRQYVNVKLKKIAIKYKISKDPSGIKSHSLRKSFGRRVFEINDNSERSLILLSDILNHTSIKTTKIYLGIRDQEIEDVYTNL